MKYNMKKYLVAFSAIPALLGAHNAFADQVIADDLIVQFSACVGNDCVNGESFGFDTLRLKENNLRINFNDTSVSASFPSNDWRLVANDTANGGSNHFSIEDSTAGNSPFRVEAGAGGDALVVEADGDVGIGTRDPVVELHVVAGDSPTLRLEQNGSSGFTPQTFDLVSNEANFFIRDVTNGSQLPFRIKPGADSNSLFIAANNDIGIGTDSPSDSLHIRRTTSAASMKIETTAADTTANIQIEASGTGALANATLTLESTTGLPRIFMNNGDSAAKWIMDVSDNQDFRITVNGSGQQEMLITETGDLTVTGSVFSAGGTCGSGCDMVFEDSYELPSIEEHAAQMWDLGYLPNVGPTIENQPINLSDKTGRMLNELEKAHIYIAQLNSALRLKNDELESISNRLESLEQLVEEKR